MEQIKNEQLTVEISSLGAELQSIKDAQGNEYHLMTYLDKVGRRPEYKVFDRTMFQNDRDINPAILNTRWTLNEDKDLDYSNMDLCVAVPVCSGLSTR